MPWPDKALNGSGLALVNEIINERLTNKQPLLTGQPGQVVGFDGMGLAYAVQGWSNRNLLDNWYFPTPINQRGVSGTITTPGYFIDRWKLVSGSVTITEGGLLLNGTIVQILEFDPGQEVTASYLTDGGTFPAEYDSGTKTFAITAEGVLIRAAKLEVGSVQTLAHQDEDGSWVLNDPPPNKALELAKCQRYLQVLPPDMYLAGWVNESRSSIHIPYPSISNMRKTPTAIAPDSIDAMDLYIDGGGRRRNITSSVCSGFFVLYKHIILGITDSNAFDYWKSCTVGIWSNINNTVLLSAEF